MKRTILTLVTAVLASLAFLTPAHAAITGSFNTIGCGGGQVKAMQGVANTNQDETVVWVPVLFRWDGQQWSVASNDFRYAWAGSVHGRTGQFYDATTNAGVLFRSWNGLGQGYYTVANYYYANSSGWTVRWASYGNSYYCQL